MKTYVKIVVVGEHEDPFDGVKEIVLATLETEVVDDVDSIVGEFEHVLDVASTRKVIG